MPHWLENLEVIMQLYRKTSESCTFSQVEKPTISKNREKKRKKTIYIAILVLKNGKENTMENFLQTIKGGGGGLGWIWCFRINIDFITY